MDSSGALIPFDASDEATTERLVGIIMNDVTNVSEGADVIAANNIRYTNCEQFEAALAANSSTQKILDTLTKNVSFVATVQSVVAKNTLSLHLFSAKINEQKENMQLSETQRDIAKYYAAKLENHFQETP